MGAMHLDGSGADSQVIRDDFTGAPIRQPVKHLPFAGAQRHDAVSRVQRLKTPPLGLLRRFSYPPSFDDLPSLFALRDGDVMGASHIENVARMNSLKAGRCKEARSADRQSFD